jgi:hypothetical protein
MSREQSDDDDQDPADEARALARSGQLQLALLRVLNDPVERWDQTPAIAARGIAEVLLRALTYIVQQNGRRRSWALDLLDDVRDQVADTSTTISDVARGGMVH